MRVRGLYHSQSRILFSYIFPCSGHVCDSVFAYNLHTIFTYFHRATSVSEPGVRAHMRAGGLWRRNWIRVRSGGRGRETLFTMLARRIFGGV